YRKITTSAPPCGRCKASNAVSGVPGRKALLWASSYFPFYLRRQSEVSAQFRAEAQRLGAGQGHAASAAEGVDVQDLRERIEQDLNRALISVYPIDAVGLANDAIFNASFENDPMNRGISPTRMASFFVTDAE